MLTKKSFLSALTGSVVSLAVIPVVFAAGSIVFYSQIKLHDADSSILKMLGYQDGSIVYFSELGAVTQDQINQRHRYETVGCNPFYVMRNGKIDESGYNCVSFYCAGYTKGPKVCRDRNENAYGGVVEISRRLSLPTINDKRIFMGDVPEADRTQYMKQRIAELEPLKCRPFYLYFFDVVVGEGYECEEVGRYPYFSNKNSCVIDMRKKNPVYVCTVAVREDEFDIRRRALGLPESSSSSEARSVSSSESSSSSVASAKEDVSSVSSASPSTKTFPDVQEGRYGFTAILDLASKGIITGYSDGTFRPKNTVNRAEFSKLLIGGLHAEEARGETRCFPDVQEEWFAPYVCSAKRLGWIAGYATGRFEANQTIRKSEAIKIVISSLGVSLSSAAALPSGIPTNEWYTPYVRKAFELGIILEGSFDPGAEVSRADTAVWIYRASKVQAPAQ